jgi:2-polyprenyl-3-methyl-5-hydroxy-6-metoxy-1,4-benzoquinol methylase
MATQTSAQPALNHSPELPMSEYGYTHSKLTCSSRYLLPVVRALLDGLPANSIILDLGCGNGSMLGQFRQCGWDLHGIEISKSGLVEAQRVFPEIHVSHGDLASDLGAHPLVGKCDVVISAEVVEHVLLPRVFAKNCYRFLKPKGVLIVSTPYHGYLKNLVLAVTGKLDAHFTALWDYGHIKFWSRRTFTQLLEEAGFQIKSCQGAGRVPFLWKSMIFVAVKRDPQPDVA